MGNLQLRRIAYGLFACLALSGETFGCSISLPVTPFEPDAAGARRAEHVAPDGPQAVTIGVGAIERTSAKYWCDFYARIDLELAWSAPSPLQWNEVGFYVRVIRADGEEATFGKHVHKESASSEAFERDGVSPEMAHLAGGKAHLPIWVGDSPPGGLLDIDVELTPIDRAGRLGPVSRIHVHSNARPNDRVESAIKGLESSIQPRDEKSYDALTRALRASVNSGDADKPEPCGFYSPYGCGHAETALLTSGEHEIRSGWGVEPELTSTACVAVRQDSGRVARILLFLSPMLDKVAGAEWVDGTDAGNWTRVAQSGCAALLQRVIAREAAFAESERIRLRRGRR